MNDNLRRFRDEFLRQIDKRTTAGLLPCVVDAPPSTWDFTVPVKIGTQLVVASYQGQAPDVGDKGWVQRRGAGYDFITQIPATAFASGGGGVVLPSDLEPLTLGEVSQAIAEALAGLAPVLTTSNSAFISTMGFWGHSYVDTLGRIDMRGTQIANRVFSLLGLSWPLARNYGAGGTTAVDDWKQIFRTARPQQDNSGDLTWQAKFGPQCFLYGANEVGQNGDPTFESNRFLNNWSRTWRGIFSWFRAGAIYYPDWLYNGTLGSGGYFAGKNVATQAVYDSIFPGGKTGVTYTGTWTQVTGSNYATIGRNAYQTTATSGATIVVHLPPNFPGTPVTLYFSGEVGQTGSTNGTITHGGTTPASPVALVTNDRVRTPSTYSSPFGPVVPTPSLYPIRIVGIPAGDKTTSQTITVNTGTLAAGHKLTFMGWSIEATHPPLLTAANIPPAGSWAGSLLTPGGLAGNTDGSLLQWASYPQSNSIQTAASGGTPYNAGVRNTAQAGDTWCRSYYNPALSSVAAEFLPIGSIAIADLATVIDGSIDQTLYSPNDLGGADWLHPNPEGKAVIAKEFLVAMNRVPLDPLHLMSTFTADDAAEGADLLGAHS